MCSGVCSIVGRGVRGVVWLLYLLVVIAANVKMTMSDKLLVNERGSECHKAVATDSEVHEPYGRDR